MQKYIMLVLGIFTLALTQLVSAKNINLYEQPKSDSKVVGTINTEVGIIPIFTPKDSNWVKVANPKDGSVGWIESTELNTKGSQFSFKMINSDKGGSQGYQVIQFGNSSPLTPQQSETLFKQMEQHQAALQKDMQKMAQDMFENTQKAWVSFPMVMPVIIMPAQQPAAKGKIESKKVNETAKK